MRVIAVMQPVWEFNRGRTLALLDAVAAAPDPRRVLAWRPRPGRAHIGWQLMHVGVTEELFASERLVGTPASFAELVPRFRGGSTPDDDVPDVNLIREVLAASRRHLLDTVGRFSESDLAVVPAALRERGWSVETVLRVLAWHEPHHQGQAHLTFNLWKAAQASSAGE